MAAPFDDPLSANASADTTIANSSTNVVPSSSSSSSSTSSPTIGRQTSRRTSDHPANHSGTISGRTVSAIESKAGQHYFDLKALQAQLADEKTATVRSHRSGPASAIGATSNGGANSSSRRDSSPTQTLQIRAQSRLGQRLADFHDAGSRSVGGSRSRSRSIAGSSHGANADDSGDEDEDDGGGEAASSLGGDDDEDGPPGALTPKSGKSRASLPTRPPQHLSAPKPIRPGQRNSRPPSRLAGAHPRQNSLASLWIQSQGQADSTEQQGLGQSHGVQGGDEEEEGFLARLHLMSDDEIQSFMGATIRAKRIPRSMSPFGAGSQATVRPLLASLQSTDEARSDRLSLQHALSSPELPSEARLHPPPDVFTVPAQQSDDASLEVCRKLSRALAKNIEAIANLRTTLEEQAVDSQRKLEAQARKYEAREAAIKTVCGQHGVSAGTVDRAVARALADMPQVSIDVQQQARARRAFSPPPEATEVSAAGRRRQSVAQSAAPADRHSRYIQAFPESEHSLGFSLQEAMLEDIDPGYGGTDVQASRSGRSGSGSSSRPYAGSSPTSSKRAMNSVRATAKSNARSPAARRPRSESKVSVSSAVTQSLAPPQTPRRPSTKAAGNLMPWSVTDSDRKASATTKATTSAAVEADGYLSDSRSVAGTAAGTAASQSPLADRGGFVDHNDEDDAPGLSSISRRPSVASARRPSMTSTYNSATLKAAPSSSASNTSSAFGFFSSLAWRRKKSTPTSTASSVVHRSSTGQPDESAGTIRTSSMPVTSPTSSAISTVLTSQSPPPPDGRNGSGLSVKRPMSPLSISSLIQASRPIINQGDRTVSGRDVISALHEAIGSAPVSPSEEPAHVIDVKLLPKPTHLKAIFLATRILGADSSSVLVHNGRETSQLVSQLTFNLVSTARKEGLNVTESSKTASQSANKTRRGTLPGQQQRARVPASDGSPASLAPLQHRREGHPRARPQSMAVQAATAVVQAAAAAAAASSTTATVGRKGTAVKSRPGDKAAQVTKKTPVEPNVTRLPLYFGLSQGYASANAPSAAARSQGQPSSIAAHRPDTEGATSEPAPPLELEPIVPLDGKPPSLAIFSRQKFRPAPSQRRAGTGPRRMRSIIDKEAQDEYDDSHDTESSGDEFEVYGGKGNIVLPTPIHSASTFAANSAGTTTSSSAGQSESTTGYDDRAVDVFGFVYDATPADVRLLRQARLASTPAPACLTGIRVGVAARGVSSDSSDNEDEDGADSAITATDEETTTLNGGDAGDTEDVGSLSESPGKKSFSKSPHPMGLLGLDKARPSTEASQLSASCVIGLESEGPTSPTQEHDFKLGSSGIQLDVGHSDAMPKIPKPKTTSETVRSLLDQLKVMHSRHQAEQMEKWDAFIQHRRVVLAQHRQHQADGSDGGAIERTRSATASGSHAVMASESSAASGDDQYHYGLIGLQQMGEDKGSRDDHKHFLKLCQEGIPLAHRPKVWAECSGANEMAEPGKYQDLLDEHAGATNQALSQIDLDIHRTMPTNIYFGGDGPGVPKLRRVLAAYSWYNPEIGYCQGMNNLAATLLLTHATEEEAFWVLVCIIEKILPPEYFSSHLLTSQADQRVLIELVHELLPRLAEHLDELGVDLPAVTFAWFLSLYTDCLPVETLFHVWDVFFTEGSIVLFRIAVAILVMNEEALLATSSPAAFYGHVHSMTSRLFSVDRLISIACHDLCTAITAEKVDGKRSRHVAGIKLELGLD